MIRLVLTDLDDTLISYGRGCASDLALAGIRACQEAGVHFAPATGRIPERLDRLFSGNAWAYSTSACVNGMVITLDEKIIHTEVLDRSALLRAQEYCKQFPRTGLAVTLEGITYGVGLDPTDGGSEDGQPVVNDVLPALPDCPIVKVNVRVGGDRALCVRMRDELTELCPELDFVFPSPRVPLIDLLPKGWSKAKGAHILCDALGVVPEEVAVFGDSDNDLDLLRAFPNSVAVANAMPDVEAAARWHIGASADDAVAHALLDIAQATAAGVMPSFMGGPAMPTAADLR